MKIVNTDVLFLVAETCCRKMPAAVAAFSQKVHPISKDQAMTLKGAVVLHSRFSRGDYRADETEVLKLFGACQLVNDLHAEANGHPKKSLDLPVSAAFSANGPMPPPAGAYGDVLHDIGGGILEGFEGES